MNRKDSAVARVMKELEEAGADAGEVLSEVRRRSVKKASNARHEIADGLDHARDAVSEFGSEVADRAGRAADVTGDYVRTHPLAILGAVAGVGLLIGMALSYKGERRR